MKKVDIRKDASFSLAAQVSAMGGLQLQAEDLETMQRFAVTMLLGVSNVTRSRQQAKLKMAQQLFHEKKLSLLKTQHMIELLHKSQEMFFEARAFRDPAEMAQPRWSSRDPAEIQPR